MTIEETRIDHGEFHNKGSASRMTPSEETDSILKRTDPRTVARLYRLLETFLGIAEADHIPFWLCEGSFLGAVRHGGIIPWDDDVDVQFFEEDEKTLWARRDDLRRQGCGLLKWWGGYKCFPLDGVPVRGEKHLYPFLDLFPSRKVRGGRVVYARFLARLEWRHSFFFEEELFPLAWRPFGPLSAPCPGTHAGYLTRNYGPDWDSAAYMSFDHVTEKKLKPRKVKLEDREPAKYTP
jgi:lipopolysaccharide cholinephosphotransferase